jgi:hypothetical protein
MEFNGFEDERMFLKSWFTKCDENSINICNLVPRVFAVGERNTLVWPGHVTRGFCVKWRIVY